MGEPYSSQPPPPSVPARIWKPDQTETQMLLLDTYWGQWVHWSGRRSFLCEGEDCPTSRHRLPVRWRGYYPACYPVQSIDIEVSKVPQSKWQPTVWTANQDQYELLAPYNDFPLLLILRTSKDKRGVEIKKITPVKRTEKTPSTFDVRLVVYRTFGIRPIGNYSPADLPEGGE